MALSPSLVEDTTEEVPLPNCLRENPRAETLSETLSDPGDPLDRPPLRSFANVTFESDRFTESNQNQGSPGSSASSSVTGAIPACHDNSFCADFATARPSTRRHDSPSIRRGPGAAKEDARVTNGLVTRLRNSDFLLGLAKYIESLQQESCVSLEGELKALRLENEQLRRQFAMSSMEVPLHLSEVLDSATAPSYRREATSTQVQEPTICQQRSPMISEENNQGKVRHSSVKVRESLTLTKGAKTSDPVVRTTQGSNSVRFAANVDGDAPDPECSLGLPDHVAGRSTLERFSIRDFQGDESQAPKPQRLALRRQETGTISKRVTNTVYEKNCVFADIDGMKEEVRQAICRRPYNVAQFYFREGWCQWIATSSAFEVITLTVIAFNALWIAVDTDYNTSASLNEAPALFQFAEYFFFAYFLFEWVIRFGAFEHKVNSLRDRWFIFDSSLVVLMIFDTCSVQAASIIGSGDKYQKRQASDTSVLKLLRMTKLTRMARMARLLRAMPELAILVKGIWVSARSVFFTLCLLGILIYIFSVAFRQLTDGSVIGEKYFSSVPDGMQSLLLYGIIPDNFPIVDDVGAEHILLAVLMLVFILLGSLTVMNMLVGVLVEVVSVVSAVEKEEMKVNFVKTQLFNMIRDCGMQPHEDMMLSKTDFEYLFMKQGAAKVFNHIGVDPVGFLDISEYLFSEAPDEGLTFKQFIEVVLQMRGSNHATVKDIVDLRRLTLVRLDRVAEALQGVADAVTSEDGGSVTSVDRVTSVASVT